MTNFVLKLMLRNMQSVLSYPNNKKIDRNQLRICRNPSPSLNEIMKFMTRNFLQSWQPYNIFDIILWVQNKNSKFGQITQISNTSKNQKNSIVDKLDG